MRASIGPERKTYYPIRTRFFDPGVCSRFCRAVSSGDFGLVAPREQRRSGYEWLGLVIQFEGNLIVSRFVGMCALHRFVGTILPSGPYEAIASFGSSKGHSLSVGPPGCGPWASAHTDAHLRVHALRELRTLFAIACPNDCLLVDSLDRAAAWLLRVFADGLARPGSYSFSSFHIRSTVAAIIRAKLSFASVGFVPPSRSCSERPYRGSLLR